MHPIESQPFAAPKRPRFEEDLEGIEAELHALYARLSEITASGVFGRLTHAGEERGIRARIDELLIEKKNTMSEMERLNQNPH
jgi:hypothetical protein